MHNFTQSEIIERQFINYCKGNYKETDLIKDILTFQGEWAGCDKNYLKANDAFWFVNMVYNKYVPKHNDIYDLVMEAYKRKSFFVNPELKLGFEDFINELISQIRQHVMIQHVQVWLKADPKFLPLNEK